MRIRKIIEAKITAALAPEHLEIIDDSASHAGHAGANPEGESHFKVLVIAKVFEGLSRVQRQRMVFDAIAEEMANHIHAMELKTLSPEESKTTS